MTLHKAIINVLSKQKKAMRPAEIAEALNTNKLYTKKDGSAIKSSQIGARAKNYPHLFVKENGFISLKSKTGFVKSSSQQKEKHVQKSQVQDQPSLAVKVLMNDKNFREVSKVTELPDEPGLYCIRIKDISKLNGIFKSTLEERNHNIIYIGIASKSLYKRLSQELWAKGHGTFFRSIGAVLGYAPKKGSLAHKKNKNNYEFVATDEAEIIEWIENNLKLNWIVMPGQLNQIEHALISQYLPLLNIAGHPEALEELQQLRQNCKNIARGE